MKHTIAKIRLIWDILTGAKIRYMFTIPPKVGFNTKVISVDNHTDQVMDIWVETFQDRRGEARK